MFFLPLPVFLEIFLAFDATPVAPEDDEPESLD
jgi:hypothetical protein